jgi:hypothetical protein
MEANSFYEQKQSTYDTLKEMMAYYQIVKKLKAVLSPSGTIHFWELIKNLKAGVMFMKTL